MKVKQLINKLKKMPKDAIVAVANNEMYVDGIYKVTSREIDYFPDDNLVVIGTDYKCRKVEK